MFHNSSDRLRGAWWGGIIAIDATSLAVDPYTLPWAIERQKLANLLLDRELSEPELVKMVANLATFPAQLQHNSSLLSLLPLTMFSAVLPTRQLREVLHNHLESANEFHNDAVLDIRGWEYLLTEVLDSKFNLPADCKLIGSGIEAHPIDRSLLPEKLSLVSESIANGSSLNLLADKLSVFEAPISTAIALAWYCFATTPHDFSLSVRRAAKVTSEATWLTAALTGTLSGAYNGMAEISGYWRTDNRDTQKQLEQQLFQRLFARWLGMYHREEAASLNLDLEAIALPGNIQPRQSLKIVSQRSALK